MTLHHQDYESPDAFDRISDDLILLVFNQISDIKTLTHCKSVSKRFNSLAPLAENLLVKVDCVISPETSDSILLHVLKSLLVSLQDLISPKRKPIEAESLSSPSQILRGFEKIKRLEIELPRGDLRLEKGIVVRWRGEFGKSLKSCVILAIREMEDGDQDQDEDQLNNGDHGLKLRVVWTISALIAASTRHYLLREVIREHEEIQNLVLRDREGEGTLVMDEKGLTEFREGQNQGEAYVSTVGWKNRTTVPAVRMRMRHVPRLVLSSGAQIRGATLVTVSPMGDMDAQDKMGDLGVGPGMFRGVYGEIAGALIKKPSYLLEMNSF